MGTTRGQPQHLRTPWDAIFGSRSQVRVLRALERARESMTVRETARRADEHLRAVQIAVGRLIETGLARRVGTGSQQLIQWNPEHPLAPTLSALFEAERERYQRIVDRLVEMARTHVPAARFVWMTEHPEVGGPKIEIGILANSADVDRMVDVFRTELVPMMKSEDIAIEVRGWTLPDLEASSPPEFSSSASVTHLWGTPARQLEGAGRKEPGHRKSHQLIDAELRERAEQIASAIQSRPELVSLAKEEIADQLKTAESPEARTLREWQQVLEALSIPKLVRWLVDEGEQATQLRQSMPLVFLRAADEAGVGGEDGR